MRRRIAALLACAGLALASLAPRAASAAEPRAESAAAIAILAPPGDRFALRVVAELEALGFRPLLLDPAAEPTSRASLEASARAAGAIAAIRAVPSARGVEVWIADRVTGKTVLREIAADTADAALALRVVELLRASLLEAALPHPPAGEVRASPEIQEKLSLPAPAALAPQPAPTLRFSLGLGPLWSPGGFGAAAAIDLGVAWMPSDHVGLAAFAAFPINHPRVEAKQGSADLTPILAGGALRFLFTTRGSVWAPSLDLGVTAVSLASEGTASAPYSATSVSAVTAAPYARLGVAFAPTPMLRVRSDLLLGAVVQSVVVRFDKVEVARWGQPIVLASAGVDFGWF
jgi:hypothetical protein